MQLYPSQIAALIEDGETGFSYRPPQSLGIIPPIDVSIEEAVALRTFGSLELNFVRLSRNPMGNQLGCCGDCEQLRFEQYIKALRSIIGESESLELRRRFEGKASSRESAFEQFVFRLFAFLGKAMRAINLREPRAA